MSKSFRRALQMAAMPLVGLITFCLSIAFGQFAGNVDAAAYMAGVMAVFAGFPLMCLLELEEGR